MSCRVTFSFVKGECIGRVIDHDFKRSSTIAEMKYFLIETHNACNPDSHSLVFVWDEEMRKLTNDNESAASLGTTANITVNIVRKPGPSKTSDARIQVNEPPIQGPVSFAVEQHSATRTQVPPRPDVNPPASLAANALFSPAPPAAQPLALRIGSRVCIMGLLTAPEMNGRKGVICEEFNAETGRWTVDIDADGSKLACRGVFRPVNLKLLRNFSSEWEDEDGCVWPKNVDFLRQCPKGHALAPRDECPAVSTSAALPPGWVEWWDATSKRPAYKFQGIQNCYLDRPGSRVMCRICRATCLRFSAECSSWKMCSVAAGCCGSYAVCGRCACSPNRDEHAPVASEDFCTIGINIQYLGVLLLHLLHSYGPSVARITTSQFCQMYIRPFTSRSRTSLVHVLTTEGSDLAVTGEASWFISHTWSNPIVDTIGAITSLLCPLYKDEHPIYVWFDVMSTSQHETAAPSKPSSWWMKTFKDSIARIGGLVLVVDAWDNPSALQRAWCVLELHAIAGSDSSGGGRFEVAMTEKERGRFLIGVRTTTNKYYNMLGRVDAECCDCSRALDRESIREAIRSTVGFEKLNRMVIEVLERWMEKKLRQELEAAIAVSNSDGQMHVLKNVSEWQHTLGSILHQQGRYNESIELMEASLKLQQTICGKDDLYTCDAMNNLAINYRQVGRFHDALLLQEKTLHIRQMHLRQNDPQIGSSMSNLARTYSELGRLQDALRLDENAYEYLKRALPADDPDLGYCMHNLGLSYGNVGRHDDAVVIMKQTLDLRRRVLPKNHPEIADSMTNLAGLYSKLGRHDDALQLHDSALCMRRRVLPPNHPSIGDSMWNTAIANDNLNRHQESLALQLERLKFLRRILPENHVQIGTALSSIGDKLCILDQRQDALKFFQEALEVKRRVLPDNDPDIGHRMHIIAFTLRELGRNNDALVLQEEVVDFYKRVLPHNDPRIGSVMHDLGRVYGALNRHADALIVREKTLEFRRLHLPKNHPYIGDSLNNLANTYHVLGRVEEAAVMMQEALDIGRRSLPENDSEIGHRLCGLASIYCTLGRLKDALQLAHESLRVHQAGVEPSTEGIKNCHELILGIKQALANGI